MEEGGGGGRKEKEEVEKGRGGIRIYERILTDSVL